MRRNIKSLLYLAIFCFAAISCRNSNNPTKANKAFWRYTPGKTMAAISAHRGGGDYKGYPENCIASFDMLAQKMPVIIECDINLTADGELVMLHDDELDRTTTGSGKIRDKKYAELKDIRLKDNFGNATNFLMPTLKEVLVWGKSKASFTLDVKRGVPYQKVVALVQQTRSQQNAAIITYNANDAALVHKLDPSLFISVTVRSREEYNRHANLGIPDSVMVAFVGTRQPDKELCAFLHQKGIRCILGTLGNLDKMAATRGDKMYLQWVNDGADILSTDRPIEAWQQIKQ